MKGVSIRGCGFPKETDHPVGVRSMNTENGSDGLTRNVGALNDTLNKTQTAQTEKRHGLRRKRERAGAEGEWIHDIYE
jgi:hypothetical protein